MNRRRIIIYTYYFLYAPDFAKNVLYVLSSVRIGNRVIRSRAHDVPVLNDL
jgi:hypothetical protein